MARPAQFTAEQIITATSGIAAQRGPAGATVARIAQALNAPTGSIYHRFASRNVLLGEVWLRATASFQSEFAKKLVGPDPYGTGLTAVLFVPSWVREHPQEARILLLHRRQDFLDGGWPAPLVQRAKDMREQMSRGLRSFCQRLLDRNDAEALRIVTFALAEAPLAAVRQYVESGKPPPSVVDALIEATYRASVALGKAQQ